MKVGENICLTRRIIIQNLSQKNIKYDGFLRSIVYQAFHSRESKMRRLCINLESIPNDNNKPQRLKLSN
jgi:hypothetical protein